MFYGRNTANKICFTCAYAATVSITSYIDMVTVTSGYISLHISIALQNNAVSCKYCYMDHLATVLPQ